MSDPTGPDASSDEVGSLGEEAAKLLGVLGEWARDVDQHVATGAEECTYCPVCRTVHLVRQASPEVREHLTTAASSFLQAAAAMLSPGGSAQPPQTGLERIDLEDDE